MTEKEKWIMKDCLALNKIKFAALLDTTAALQLTMQLDAFRSALRTLGKGIFGECVSLCSLSSKQE